MSVLPSYSRNIICTMFKLTGIAILGEEPALFRVLTVCILGQEFPFHLNCSEVLDKNLLFPVTKEGIHPRRRF